MSSIGMLNISKSLAGIFIQYIYFLISLPHPVSEIFYQTDQMEKLVNGLRSTKTRDALDDFIYESIDQLKASIGDEITRFDSSAAETFTMKMMVRILFGSD
mgnify:CR=1 FL=1